MTLLKELDELIRAAFYKHLPPNGANNDLARFRFDF